MDQLDTLEILAVDHVGIAVPDLPGAIAFHTGTLGGVLEHTEHNDEQQIDEAMIAFGDGARIQLIAPAGPDSTIARFLDRSGPGLQQLAYRVPDVRAAADALRRRGIRLLYPEPRRGTAGSLINFVHPKDAGGVLVELVQAAAGQLDGDPRRPDADRGGDPGRGADRQADPAGIARGASQHSAAGDGTMTP